MFYLVQLDPNDFTKIVANKVIGKLNAGYERLDIFRAHIVTNFNDKRTVVINNNAGK